MYFSKEDEEGRGGKKEEEGKRREIGIEEEGGKGWEENGRGEGRMK